MLHRRRRRHDGQRVARAQDELRRRDEGHHLPVVRHRVLLLLEVAPHVYGGARLGGYLKVLVVRRDLQKARRDGGHVVVALHVAAIRVVDLVVRQAREGARIVAHILALGQVVQPAERVPAHQVHRVHRGQPDRVARVLDRQALARDGDVALCDLQRALVDNQVVVGRIEHARHRMVVDAVDAVAHIHDPARGLRGRAHLARHERARHVHRGPGQRVAAVHHARARG